MGRRDFMPVDLQQASSSFMCKHLGAFVRSHVQCTDPGNNGGALYLSAAERYRCLGRRSLISSPSIELRRRHNLVCYKLVNLVAFLVQALSGERTEPASQELLSIQAPVAFAKHIRSRAVHSSYEELGQALYVETTRKPFPLNESGPLEVLYCLTLLVKSRS